MTFTAGVPSTDRESPDRRGDNLPGMEIVYSFMPEEYDLHVSGFTRIFLYPMECVGMIAA